MSKTTKVIIALLVVAVVAVGAVLLLDRGEGTDNNTNDTGNTSETMPEEPENAQEAAATITYTNDGFSPATVTVPSGSTIRVVNESDSDVGPSSDPHPIHNINPELNFPDIAPGESASLTVTETGTWGYHNHFKEDHHATIIVE